MIGHKKYFFDLNNFDQPQELDDAADLPPPPPTFTLDELGAAKEDAYKTGYDTATQYEKNSREQFIAAQIAQIKTQLNQFAGREDARNRLFEEEVLSLCQAVFKTAFPALNQSSANNEILAIITKVLKEQDSLNSLDVYVTPDCVEEIKALAGQIAAGDTLSLNILPDNNLKTGDCRITWKNGGLSRHMDKICTQISESLTGLLTQKVKTQDTPQADEAAVSEPALARREDLPQNENEITGEEDV